MRAVILCAGMGNRLALPDGAPKVLLRFGPHTLLKRHLRILRGCGIARIDLCLGYRAETIIDELDRMGSITGVGRHLNPDFAQGSVVSLWTVRDILRGGDDILFMDGDVLYDQRLMRQLLEASQANCFAMDRALEAGEEPVKLCLQEGQLVDIGKQLRPPHRPSGEWIGFARFAPAVAADIADATDRIVAAGRRDAVYEDAFRDVLFAATPGVFVVEDISGVPWIEIDFPADLERAHADIFPRLVPLPE